MKLRNAQNESSGPVDFYSSSGYLIETDSPVWVLSPERKVDFDLLPAMSNSFEASLRTILAIYARTRSDHHTYNMYSRFRKLVNFLSTRVALVEGLDGSDILNYKDYLGRQEWYLGAVAGFLKEWHSMGLPGVQDSAIQILSRMRLKGNRKGEAVATRSVTDGAFSDLEFEALHNALHQALESNELRLAEVALVALFLAFGRRRSQLAWLRHCDFHKIQSDGGLVEFFLNISRAKQRGQEFRGSFKLVALDPDLGLILERLLKENESRFRVLGISKKVESADLPIFPDWRAIRASAELTASELNELNPRHFHRLSATISYEVRKTCGKLNVVSERTGQPVHVYPTRFRRTLGTRAAREGYGRLVIAELLDHSDTQNAGVYTENVPEHAEAIDQAVGWQLASYAQAFAGTLVGSEAEAVRGDDPASRLRTDAGELVGTCGSYGFCSARAPLACYTCRKFQPWLDAPHENYLEQVLAEEARIAKITGDLTISGVNRRTVLAIMQVVLLCADRRRSLVSSNDGR